ncbi:MULTISPECIES: hypothetical protein [unclassified Leucobacter]|uniref:hypothetical protein n=1 Tax=unclassified Leucobacter TaxID=2621730 RepID=UPI00165DBC8A|nr:hypothetical protein [Leucobacter sp. CX169]MBC9927913.1 hypothetical protein [Leucobacter sp. cx-169]MBC9937620.1 hypothetical protein [Leucobacter sp. cx-87]
MTQHDTAGETRGLVVVDAFFGAVFKQLERWRPELEAQLSARMAAGPLSGAQLSELVEDEANRLLQDDALPLYGAGFCASDAIVASGSPLSWWQGPDRSPLVASTFGVGQGAIDLRRLEWYRVPEATGQRHVAGPFVDYLCSNEITMTSAVPLTLDGVFAGVICADVLVATLERELLPQLGDGATLLSSAGRVIVSADPSCETGDLFTEIDIAGGERELAGARVESSSDSSFVIIAPAE